MRNALVRLVLLAGIGCRSDVAQQDAIAVAREKGADIRISISGDAQRVSLRRCSLDQELKAAVRQMPAIETLIVSRDFSDAEGDLLEHCAKLKNLDLSHSKITIQTIESLKQMRSLEFLSLNGLTLSDADMNAVSALRQLTSISLVDADVSEDALKRFQEANPQCTMAR